MSGRGTEWLQRAERAGASAGASADARYRQAERGLQFLSERVSERTLLYERDDSYTADASSASLPVTHMRRSICRSRGAASSDDHAVLSAPLCVSSRPRQ